MSKGASSFSFTIPGLKPARHGAGEARRASVLRPRRVTLIAHSQSSHALNIAWAVSAGLSSSLSKPTKAKA